MELFWIRSQPGMSGSEQMKGCFLAGRELCERGGGGGGQGERVFFWQCSGGRLEVVGMKNGNSYHINTKLL